MHMPSAFRKVSLGGWAWEVLGNWKEMERTSENPFLMCGLHREIQGMGGIAFL